MGAAGSPWLRTWESLSEETGFLESPLQQDLLRAAARELRLILHDPPLLLAPHLAS